MPIQCKKCGFENPENMRFCGNCGLRLLGTHQLDMQENNKPELDSTSNLGTLVGADLMERFQKAGLEAAGQRRQVTVLFVDLSGYTSLSQKIDGEALYDLVQDCSKMFANAVYKYDGMVDKFTGDGLMALFGAPIAHENNAELAIRASLDMQTNLKVLSKTLQEQIGQEIQAHIGLNSGMVVVGGVGSNRMMNYTAIGDVVNLASRIESAAISGETLVSESVYRQARAFFDFETMEPKQLKGVSQPVQTYRVVGPKARPGSVRGLEGLYSPMIGRDAELERLRQTMTSVLSSGTGRFAAIHGEAGIGKSRLIAEFKAFVASLPVQVMEGYCLVYRKGISYWLFQDILQRLLEIDINTSQTETHTRLYKYAGAILPERVDEILPYLEHLLLLPFSDPAAARRIEFLTPDQLRQQTFLSMRDLLLAAAQVKPVVLILEDLHWLDDASLQLVDYLLDQLVKHPIAIIAVSRQFTEEKLAALTHKASDLLRLRFQDMALSSLSPDQSDRLLSQLASIRNLPEALRNEIVARSSGIPLYMEEILRMLIDRQVLLRSDGHLRLSDTADYKSLGVPDTLEGLILARVDNLSLVERQLLKVGSVIGRAFTREILLGCNPNLTEHECDETLVTLLDREFILPDPSPGGEYMFKHVLVADTIYRTLLKRERKELHGLVALTIEKFFAGHLENQVDVLARHYFYSDYSERALHYLILAGQKSARSYNSSQAQKYYEDALTLLPDTKHTLLQKFYIHSGLGDAFALRGEYPEAHGAYENAARAIADAPESRTEIASELQRKIGTNFERQAKYDEAMECLEHAQLVLTQAGLDSPVELSQILNDTGWLYYRRGRLDEAEKFFQQALALAESTKRLDVISSIYNRMGGVYFHSERLEEASEYTARGLAIREEIGDIIGVARSYNNLGLLGWKRGLWDEALESFKRCAQYQTSLGDVEAIILLNGNLGLLELDRGNTGEAFRYFDEALKQSEGIGLNLETALNNQYFCRLYIALEDWQKAMQYGRKSEELFKNIGDEEFLVDVYMNLAAIHLGTGELAAAQEFAMYAQECLLKVAGDEPTEEKGRILRLLGEIALTGADYNTAVGFFRQAEPIFASTNQLERARLLVSLSRLARALANVELVRSLRSMARVIFLKLGAKLDLQKLDVLEQSGG